MPRLPKPGGDDGTWGLVLNDFLREEHNEDGSLKQDGRLAAKADRGLTDALTARMNTAHNPDGTLKANDPMGELSLLKGHHEVVVYDDFTRYNNGPLNGQPPLIGPTWVTSGASPIQVVNGEAITNQPSGTGYMWANADGPIHYIECTMVLHGTPTSGLMTMAWSNPSSLNDLLHSNINPTGFNCSFRQDGEASWGPGVTDLVAGNWKYPMVPGYMYRVGILVRDEMWMIIGPHGEVFSASDPRVRQISAKNAVFWEPTGTPGGNGIGLTSVRALRLADGDTADTLLSPMDLAGMAVNRDVNERVVAGRDTFWQVSMGTDTSGMAGILLGPTKIRTRLSTDVPIGATSITTEEPLGYGGITFKIGGGDSLESLTTSGNSSPLPGAGYPYTHNVATPTTKVHNKGDVVYTTSGLKPRKSVSYAVFNGDSPLAFSGIASFWDKVYLRSDATVFLVGSAQGVVQVAGVGRKGVYRNGYGTTGERPVASAVGAGAEYFDTTLSKPIWSDGTNWRDAAGNVV